MPATVNDIVAQMRAALRVSEPDLDTSIGTPVRKILDAVGEAIAEASTDTYLLDYQYDLEAKSGDDLDDFVALFGFARYPARRSTGMVVFERSTAAQGNILIPVGTQVATEEAASVVVGTMVPAVLPLGETTVSVPVQALVGGSQGNIPANALRRRVTPIDGINAFTNPESLTGGADPESDAQLRLRFKRTVFRNLAGTEQMYLGVALDDPAVSQANVVGATKRFREQVEMQAGVAVSTVVDDAHTYAGSSVFGPDIDGGSILTPGVHYNFLDTEPPSVQSLDATVVPDGLYQLEFSYVSTASRNDPTNGVTNRVDIYVNGSRPTEATETAIFRADRRFSDVSGDALNTGRFRTNTDAEPGAGDYFVPLAFNPLLSPPNSVIINGQTWGYEGVPPVVGAVDTFYAVWDDSNEGGTFSSLTGLGFRQTGALPPDGEQFSITYIFNAVPRDIELAVRAWRLVTTDVRVHAAKVIRLRLNLAIIFSPGYSESVVRPELEDALIGYITGVGFNGVIQVSDLLAAAHSVPGVDSVRFLSDDDDPVAYGIQRISFGVAGVEVVGETFATDGRARDVLLGDDELAILHDVVITAKAQNSFQAWR